MAANSLKGMAVFRLEGLWFESVWVCHQGSGLVRFRSECIRFTAETDAPQHLIFLGSLWLSRRWRNVDLFHCHFLLEQSIRQEQIANAFHQGFDLKSMIQTISVTINQIQSEK